MLLVSRFDSARDTPSAASGVATLVSLAPDHGKRILSEIPTAEDLSGSGRYREIKQLAKGANGIVVLSFDLKLRRYVIVKVVPGNECKQLKLFEEAEVLAQLSHPEVIRIYDIDNVESVGISMVIEYVEGVNLEKWMETPRSLQECVEIFIKAGQGLVAVHGQDIVHRDFKPANVMVGQDGKEVKVVDFGLASYQEDLNASSSEDDLPSRTHLGKMVGTPAYMSPEQFDGEVLDARADQFSFCVALFEAVYGQRPFVGGSSYELYCNIIDGKMIDIRDNPEVPDLLKAIILKGLSTNPKDRYPTMDELLIDLEQVFAQEERREVVVPKRRRAFELVLAGALGVVSGGAAVAAIASGESSVVDCRNTGFNTIENAWNPGIRERVVRASFNDENPEPIPFEVKLDTFAYRWMQKYNEVCQMESDKVRNQFLGCLEVQAVQFGLSVEGNFDNVSGIVVPNVEECFEVNYR